MAFYPVNPAILSKIYPVFLSCRVLIFTIFVHTEKILHNEGVINVLSNNNYEYQFFIKDHLGNTRVVCKPDFNSNGTLKDKPNELQRSDYYPFGMLHGGITTQPHNKTENHYLYNGKEMQYEQWQTAGCNITSSLHWYDYGARFYDAQLGRFHTVDPLAEDYSFQSPYVYAANDPIRFIDVNGEAPGNPKTSIYILLPHAGIRQSTIDATASNGNWHFINANNLQDANSQLSTYLGDTKADNIVISSHGTGMGGSGGVVKTGNGSIKTLTLSNYIQSKGDKATFTEGVDYTEQDFSNIESLKAINSQINEGGNLAITSCGLGKDSRFGDYAQQILGGSTNLLVNQDNSRVAMAIKTNTETLKRGGKIVDTKVTKTKYILLNSTLTATGRQKNGWLNYGQGWTKGGTPSSFTDLKMNTNTNPALEKIERL